MTQVNINPVVEETIKEQTFTIGDYFWISSITSKDMLGKNLAILAQVEPNMLKLIMVNSGNRFTDYTINALPYSNPSNPNSPDIGLTMDQMKRFFDKNNRYTFTPIKEVTITAKD